MRSMWPIGAQTGKKLRIDGSDAEGVFSAVDVLSRIGEGQIPDYSGKKVVVIGGGNVAMDCARTAVRAKADEVSVVYRRRKDDMTALDTEIEGAAMEGVEMMTLMAPDRIEKDKDGNCCGLWVRPQMIGPNKAGRRLRWITEMRRFSWTAISFSSLLDRISKALRLKRLECLRREIALSLTRLVWFRE